MATWKVQDAKARFSELLKDAETKGPQIVTKHGSEIGVVLSMDQYRKITAAKQPNIIEYLMSGPKFEDGDNPFENLRDPNDTGREFEF